MTYTCENCSRKTELFYCHSDDAYFCEDCIEDRAADALDEDEEDA